MSGPSTFSSTSRQVLLVAFTASGFSGLIYESLWTHYLKLFLGHAAYAQTLVLVIFMGGMALGAWFCSRRSERWPNLLRAYAAIEAVIGLAALVFHPVFRLVVETFFWNFTPPLESTWSIAALKWGLGAGLILPQSILLGMTFPLMAGGFLRAFPGETGRSLGVLYFCNSIGAATGVLASGFFLIPYLGLALTGVAGGALNIALALAIWRVATTGAPTAIRSVPEKGGLTPSLQVRAPYGLLLSVSMLTGTASFVYEIAWIRMLSLVLGSSTQAFELMLSAFILGLALGGLWIRRRADRLKEPIRFLAGIQIAMGAMAVATLPVYGSTFRAMRWLVGTLPKTSMGYLEFNIASQGIAMLVMLPATFLAGTTLPLLTLTLVRAGRGESSIGAVYAANTLGAIAGVIAAVHVGLPLLGLKSLIVAGAAIDIGLGLLLLWVFRKKVQEPVWMAAAATAWLGLIVAAVDLDPRLMSSGVFRVNQKALGAEEIVLFHHDGKTATVDVTEDGSVVAIRTNGKIDATVNMVPSSPTVDELTQVLIAALPLLFHPKPSLVANIGLGSGMTTHVLLSDARIESLDTVEIEQGMVAGAMRFRPVNERAFSDPRSHIVIDDAKTFFSMQRKQYDVIVSEPSNPWVSGTASLFSTEFYRLVRHSLAPRGLFLQWLQLYEFDIGLVASVLKSLGDHFDDYVIYTAAPGDVVIIAVSEGLVPDHSGDLRLNTALGRELSRIWIRSEQDLMIRKIGDKRLLQPWVTASPIQPHSDYRPVLDHGAARARFVNRDASELLSLALGALPVAEMFGTSPRPWPSTHVTYSPHFAPDLYVALRLHDSLTARSPVHGASGAAPDADRMAMSARLLQDCASAGDERRRRLNIDQLAFRLANYLRPEEIERVWPAVLSLPCALSANGTEREWLALLRAVGQRDAEAMAASAERLLSQASSMDDTERRAYVLSAGMLGHLASGRPERAQALAVMKKEPRPSKRLAFTASVLEAHANASSAQDRRGWRITSGANALPAHSR